MNQVVVVHGGTSFATHEDYISFLETREVSLDRLKSTRDWKDVLQDELGAEFEVLRPRMPNSTNARYGEWSMWFERCSQFFQDGVILVGHSLGGVFLVKYLSEHSLPAYVAATILVAAPFDGSSTRESLVDFVLPDSLELFEQRAGSVYIFHSTDDPVVLFKEAETYQQALLQAQLRIFHDRAHFNQQDFPEVIETIRNVR